MTALAASSVLAPRPGMARVLALDGARVGRGGAADDGSVAGEANAARGVAPAGAERGPPFSPTPALTEGPFYPPAFTPEPLRRLYRGSAPSAGTAMRLTGRVVDVRGRPLSGARIEIWQCDARGRSHHPRDRGAADRDPDFEGFGWQPVGRGGDYDFATIVPVPYPGRTPHVHVRIRHDGRIALTSQIFLPEETAANGRDFLWRSLAVADRARVAGTDGIAGAGALADALVDAPPADPPPVDAGRAPERPFAPRGERWLLCDLVVSDV